MTEKSISVYILAGGESRRMGTDKGLVQFNNKPMISYAIENAKAISSNIVIVTQSTDYLQFGVPTIADILPSKGPMGGIYTALKSSKTELNLILPCDSPNLLLTELQTLIKSCDSTPCLAQTGEKKHPVIGIYHKKDAASLQASIQEGQLSLFKWANANNTKWVQFDNTTAFNNINSPEDLL